MQFIVKNAGPGIFFACFGAIIISIMIHTGSPELIMEKQQSIIQDKPIQSEEAESSKQTIQTKSRIQTRSESIDNNNFYDLLLTATQYHKENKYDKAIKKYIEVLQIASEPMNELAWLWMNENEEKVKDALILSNASLIIKPDDTNYLDTYTNIKLKLKNSEALNNKK